MSAPSSPFDDSETISVPHDEPLRSNEIRAFRVQATGEELEVPGEVERVVLGKGVGCDVVLQDRSVSRRHCVLERTGEAMFVRDRNSRNGTYLNGNRVQAAEIRPGALLKLGSTTLVALGVRGRGRLTAIEQLLGSSPEFRAAVDMAVTAGRSECNVLIVGETGCGKELVARAVHEASPRSAAPFIAVNCGAIARDLIGSELFGHREGAFTGATADRDGVFAKADGGSLFLDELAELPLEQQPHLLRVLETRLVRPVGAERERIVDVRVIAATNRAVGDASRLRQDLYHRLATIVVELPPLRSRPSDIPILVNAFVDEFAQQRGSREVSPETMRALVQHSWPGNVRELRHSVQRAMMLCPRELTLDVLLRPVHLVPGGKTADGPTPAPLYLDPTECTEFGPLRGIERDMMVASYNEHGNVRGAAEALGMAKSTFSDRARRFGIKLRQPRKGRRKKKKAEG